MKTVTVTVISCLYVCVCCMYLLKLSGMRGPEKNRWSLFSFNVKIWKFLIHQFVISQIQSQQGNFKFQITSININNIKNYKHLPLATWQVASGKWFLAEKSGEIQISGTFGNPNVPKIVPKIWFSWVVRSTEFWPEMVYCILTYFTAAGLQQNTLKYAKIN